MEPNGVASFRNLRSPSSDRFLVVFSPPKTDTTIASDDVSLTNDELNEDDVFWTGDFTESSHRSTSPSPTSVGGFNTHRQAFQHPEKFGILAALSEDSRKSKRPVIYGKHSIASSSSSTATLSSKVPVSSSSTSMTPFLRPIPAIPKPPAEREHSQSVPARRFQQSAPVNVPMMPARVPRKCELADVDIGDEEEDDEMLPPHEIVDRGSARSPKTTFSVLEGVGRTLKGRDLRQVRNAVWRQTGFLD